MSTDLIICFRFSFCCSSPWIVSHVEGTHQAPSSSAFIKDDLSLPSWIQKGSGLIIVTRGQFPHLVRLVEIQIWKLTTTTTKTCWAVCGLKLCRQKYNKEKGKPLHILHKYFFHSMLTFYTFHFWMIPRALKNVSPFLLGLILHTDIKIMVKNANMISTCP